MHSNSGSLIMSDTPLVSLLSSMAKPCVIEGHNSLGRRQLGFLEFLKIHHMETFIRGRRWQYHSAKGYEPRAFIVNFRRASTTALLYWNDATFREHPEETSHLAGVRGPV
jgi:hypothetical protein